MRLLLIMMVFVLVGCVSLSQDGIDSLNAGQYQEAYNTFHECAKQGDSYCINNIGFMYEKGHMNTGVDLNIAIQYYTLAARYGNTVAQNNLAIHGQPIPPVDLVAQPQQSSHSSDAAMALLLGSLANGYLEGQQQTRVRRQQELEKQQVQQVLDQMNKPVRCTSQIDNSGEIINTTCR